MNLFFDARPPELTWCRMDGDTTEERRETFSKSLLAWTAPVGPGATIGYLLHHGGEAVSRPVTPLTPEILDGIREKVWLFPEQSDLTFKTAETMMERFPEARHLLYCDTGFYAGLPPEAAAYAVPASLRRQGVRRYGGYGIFHQWAWKKAAAAGRPVRRMVGVYMGPRTNLTAIADGQPVETTIGFTAVEGLPTVHSCGDIDPTVLFQLQSTGMSFEDINRILSRESGFSGLLGRLCRFRDIIAPGTDEDLAAVRTLYLYHVVRTIGSFAAVLGGLDAVFFMAKDPAAVMPLVADVCRSFEFLGIRRRGDTPFRGPVEAISAPDSPIAVLCGRCTRWDVMRDLGEE